eukprot:gene12675-12802_t
MTSLRAACVRSSIFVPFHVNRLKISLSTAAAAAVPGLTHAEHPGSTAAYIHLPFCKRKCFYCDFPVEAVGLNVDTARTQDRIEQYVNTVCSEIRATSALSERPLETISFGGGTPSLVPPKLLEQLLTTLQEQFGIAVSTAEISMEADPGTFDLARLMQYKALGVNRLSLGVQSFQEELLQTCGRSHTLADVYAAIDCVKAAGIHSWSLDLISGLPKLTLESWQTSLEQAVAAHPNHISIYDLQVEEGTPFARWYPPGASPLLPPEPEAAAMFELASSILAAAGYQHYEISNYAQPGHRSRHNQVYWRCEPYYAFGLGAASYTRGRRFTRPRKMEAYQKWVSEYVQSGSGCPAAHVLAESQEEQLLDSVMLSLRLSDGLDLQHVQQKHGAAVVAQLLPGVAELCHSGLMQLVEQQLEVAAPQAGERQPSLAEQSTAADQQAAMMKQLQQRLAAGNSCAVRLTDPAGFLLSNNVISELFVCLDPSALSAAAAPSAAAEPLMEV